MNAGGIWANELGRLAGVEIPVVPMEHQYLITRPIEGVRADFPTLRDPDNLVYVREEVGGLVVGGYERNPDPWHVERPDPARLQPPAPAREVGAVRVDRRRRVPADPAAADDRDQPVHQRPRGVHARRRLHPRRDRGRRVLRRGRLLRPRRDGRGRDRAMDRGVDRRGRAVDGPVEDGHPALRAPVRAAATTRSRRPTRSTRSTTTSGTRARRTRPDGRSGWRRRTRAWRQLDAEFGEKAGWERANWFRSNEDPAHEDRRPRGWAGEQWSTAIVAEHLAVRETSRAVRRDELREVRGLGTRRAGPAAAPLRQRRRRARRPRRLHADAEPPRRDRVGSHRHAARPRPVPARHRDRRPGAATSRGSGSTRRARTR